MKESEYLTVTNRLKITLAGNLLRDVLVMDEEIVSKKELARIIEQLYQWQQKLFESHDVEGE